MAAASLIGVAFCFFAGAGACKGTAHVSGGEARHASPSRGSQAEGRETGGDGRLAPSSELDCPRDLLTSFMGRVLAYQRDSDRIMLRVHTDEGTVESFTLRFRKSEGPLRWLLLHGRPFRQEDWPRIESDQGRLREGMRVIVWICEGAVNPVLDWRPIEEPREAVPAPPVPG